MRSDWKTTIALAAAMMAGACASLPDLPRAVGRSPGKHVAVRGEQGILPPERAQRVVDRLAREGNTDMLRRHLAVMESITDAPLTLDNDVRLLVDGPATHEAMLEALESAQSSINLQSYILEDFVFGRSLSDLLLRKRAEGIDVHVLYDSVGSMSTPKAFFEKLARGGVKSCEFNPVNPFLGQRWRLNNRDHRKILVVDGRIAFTGGINFSNVYSSAPSRRRKGSAADGWRDTHIAVRGQAVTDFQHLFVDTWTRQECKPMDTSRLFPRLNGAGERIVRVVGSSPDNNVSEIYLALLSAIEHAQSQVYITMAYFVPDANTLRILKDAAQRGVDVKLLLPGFSDFWAVFHAGRSHYADLLTAGVKIYERRDALLHAKTAVIDGVWSTVGSTNMDWRGFLHNDEVNAIVIDEQFGAQMIRLFQRDLVAATPIDVDEWAHRSNALRFKEWFARRWEYLL